MVKADSVIEALSRAGAGRVAAREPMARHTSWRIGGPADYLCQVEDLEQLQGAVAAARAHGLPWVVLGGGNNILVSDEGVEELACGAGVFFARAAQFTARRGFTGLEWGIAIPGTVGGGVVNNAGAHWSDVSRALGSADVMDHEGRSERLSPESLAYRYRQSALKSSHLTQTRLVVTGCRFRLRPDDPAAALARVEALRQHRLRTQPVKEASAGSTFTNPPEHHAGALIDRAGLKGARVGGAQVSTLHANFILNTGDARAADVVTLIRRAQQEVLRRFGVRLEPEVQFVGRWPREVLQAMLGEAA